MKTLIIKKNDINIKNQYAEVFVYNENFGDLIVCLTYDYVNEEPKLTGSPDSWHDGFSKFDFTIESIYYDYGIGGEVKLVPEKYWKDIESALDETEIKDMIVKI